MDESAQQERLHKFLARSGAASRRECENYIRDGRVSVDGTVVRSMGILVDPERQDVRLDGERVRCEPAVSYVVYKPPGVVCTTDDQFGRTAVTELVRDRAKRKLFSVGRMEEEAEGLIIVTNDGDLSAAILKRGHPLRQTWFLKLRGECTPARIDQLREGVWLSDGRTGPIWVQVLRKGSHVTTVLASPALNQHRMLRRAFAKVGLLPDQVVRIRIGHLTTENLKERGYRRLTAADVQRLLEPLEEDMKPAGLKAPPPGGRRDKDSDTYRPHRNERAMESGEGHPAGREGPRAPRPRAGGARKPGGPRKPSSARGGPASGARGPAKRDNARRSPRRGGGGDHGDGGSPGRRVIGA